MRLPESWWRDRVRCCAGRIEEFGGDLLIAPGPATPGWLLTADQEPEHGQVLARGVRILRCTEPPPPGDPIAYPGVCAEDWYQVALDGAAGEGATTVILPPLCHPDGNAGVAEGAMVSIRRGLLRHPSLRRLLIVCAEEATAERWRAALFGAGRPHPCPTIAAELMRLACADGDGPILPEACYRDRMPGCLDSGEGIVYYQFTEESGLLRLEVCEVAGPDRQTRHLVVRGDGTSAELPSFLGRRAVPSPIETRASRPRRMTDIYGPHRPAGSASTLRDRAVEETPDRRSPIARDRLRS